MSTIKTSTILKRAKLCLWDGIFPNFESKFMYVCFAIAHAPIKRQGGAKKTAVMCEINRRLFPHGSIAQWLCHNLSVETNRVQLQQYRHRWLDSLIKEYEAKGD